MKKRIIVMIVVMILGSYCLFFVTEKVVIFTPPDGAIYNYMIKEASLNATLNDMDYICSGLFFENQDYEVNATITVEVVEKVADWINYTVAIDGGEEVAQFFSEDWVKLYFGLYFNFMHDMAANIAFNGNESYLITHGLWLHTLVKTFFLPVSDTEIIAEIENLPEQMEEALTEATSYAIDFKIYEKYDF